LHNNFQHFPGGAKKTTAAPSKTPSVNVNTNPTMPTNSVESVVVETNSINGALVGPGVARPSRVLNMPVDPNEPTYCLCNQVSYGEMIACDNPGVSILILIYCVIYTFFTFILHTHFI